MQCLQNCCYGETTYAQLSYAKVHRPAGQLPAVCTGCKVVHCAPGPGDLFGLTVHNVHLVGLIVHNVHQVLVGLTVHLVGRAHLQSAAGCSHRQRNCKPDRTERMTNGLRTSSRPIRRPPPPGAPCLVQPSWCTLVQSKWCRLVQASVFKLVQA